MMVNKILFHNIFDLKKKKGMNKFFRNASFFSLFRFIVRNKYLYSGINSTVKTMRILSRLSLKGNEKGRSGMKEKVKASLIRIFAFSQTRPSHFFHSHLTALHSHVFFCISVQIHFLVFEWHVFRRMKLKIFLT
jgi:hypothetical protein